MYIFIRLTHIWNCRKRKKDDESDFAYECVCMYVCMYVCMFVRQWGERFQDIEPRFGSASALLSFFGDVSELLLDWGAVDILEVEGLGGGSGKTAPFQWVPTARGSPHRVHAWGLDLLNGLLDGVKAIHESRVRLGKGDVQQLPVVVFVLNHFDGWAWNLTKEFRDRKDRGFGSARKALP